MGSLALKQGGKGSIIVVGPANNPNGATLVTPGDDPKKPHTSLLPSGCAFLTPGQYLEILCMQERGFGSHSFPAPTGLY